MYSGVTIRKDGNALGQTALGPGDSVLETVRRNTTARQMGVLGWILAAGATVAVVSHKAKSSSTVVLTGVGAALSTLLVSRIYDSGLEDSVRRELERQGLPPSL